MSTSTHRAAAAALEWLEAQDAPESAIVAHEARRAASTDEARRWVRQIVDGERGGAWDGQLLPTATALLVLHELREAASLAEQDPAIGRAVDWVQERKSAPGAWTDGCTPERHRRGLCHHFAAGFYSPAPPGQELTEVDLPSGARTTGDAEARFAISAAALRCVLLWRGSGTDTRLHLGVLRRLATGWVHDPPEALTTTGLLAATHALITSSRPGDRTAAGRTLRVVAGRQRGDGSWIDADPFHALAVFDAAAAVGVGDARVTAAIDHGARLLAATQRADGSWGPEHGPRRALIGWRTLHRSARTTG